MVLCASVLTQENTVLLQYPRSFTFSSYFVISLLSLQTGHLPACSQERSHLASIKREFSQLQEEGRRLRDDMSRNSRHMGFARRRLWKAQQDKGHFQRALMYLQTAEEEEESRVDVATYDGEIQECREGLEAMGRDRDRKEAELKAAKDEVRECDRRISETDAGVDAVTEKTEDIKVCSEDIVCVCVCVCARIVCVCVCVCAHACVCAD